jgi:hypothetical protein
MKRSGFPSENKDPMNDPGSAISAGPVPGNGSVTRLKAGWITGFSFKKSESSKRVDRRSLLRRSIGRRQSFIANAVMKNRLPA